MKTEELSAIISVFIGSRQTLNECAFCSMLSEPRYQDLCLAPHSDDLQVIHEKRDRIRVKDEIRVKPLESRADHRVIVASRLNMYINTFRCNQHLVKSGANHR